MKLFFYFPIAFGILLLNLKVQGDIITDVISSGGTIIEGLGKEIPNIIPTTEELFQLPLQGLIGLPEIAIAGTINQLCSIYLAANTIEPRITPNMDKLSLRLRTPCKEFSYSLSEAEKLLDNPKFDVDKKVVIFVPGWGVSSERDYVIQMAEAFACRGGYNFLAFNSSDVIRTLYTWSAYNTDEVGNEIAKALKKLVDKVPVENIHLIGHSLGAQIVGATGRYFSKYTGLNLTRITGLDPANPCFNEGEILSGIQRGDADFIDIIHSNPGVFGKKEPLGDVDFYPGGLAPIKPGCFQPFCNQTAESSQSLSLGCIQPFCSHTRSILFFTETVYPGNENNFLAVRCTSLKKLNDDFCDGPKIPMGFSVPYNLKGNYFLDVNAEPPYGQNSEGRNAVPSQCEKCEN